MAANDERGGDNVTLTRRHLLEMLLGTPVAWTLSGCAPRSGRPHVDALAPLDPALAGLFAPPPSAPARRAVPVIDVHAHFFNAADVPVRGFIEDCLGHGQSLVVRQLIKALARLAARLAANAPTASEELRALQSIATEARAASRPADSIQSRAAGERAETARRVRDVIRGSEFERLYRALQNSSPERRGQIRTGALSPDEILSVLAESETPAAPDTRRLQPAAGSPQSDADAADGLLAFVNYMVSARWMNIQTYMKAFTTGAHAFGVDTVLGALVDFEHWLTPGARSPQEDQLALHGRLAELHGAYFRPLAAYNPWADIRQDGAALVRVLNAFERGFAGVKIYPPIGFRPAGNATIPASTSKPRPNLAQLDRVLERFFDACADRGIPVVAHTAHSNGRDNAHDDFGGPQGWDALLHRYASRARSPIVSFGHLGGAGGTTWTQDFADLMHRRPDASVYGDLGYWDALACPPTAVAQCSAARDRLGRALAITVGNGSAADRVMFGSDWLMLSQVKRWADYPANLHHAVASLVDARTVDKIFGGIARMCFQRVTPTG